MGGWGFYDDENDTVADIWISLELGILPKSFFELKKKIPDQWETMNDIRCGYARNNPKLIYAAIKKWLIGFKRTMIKAGYSDPSAHISGIALRAARVFQNLPVSDPLGAGIFDSKIPKELPKGYPEWLRLEALAAVKRLIAEADENKLGWKDLKKRKIALQHELFYFSRGKLGKEGVHPKIKA